MKILLIPYRVKNLKELVEWVSNQEVDMKTVLGVRPKCKITNISEFSFRGPRWNSWHGVPIYYNF